MELAQWFIQVDQNMKDNGIKVKNTEEVFTIMKMGWFFKVILLWEENMEMEPLSSKMEQKY